MSGVAAHWGRRFDRLGITSRITKYFGAEKVSPDTGFNEIFQTPFEEEVEDSTREAIGVAARTIDESLEQAHLRKQDISGLYVGSGTPKYKDYAAAIAKAAGLHHLDGKLLRNFYMACNSGGRAFQRAITDPETQGKKILVTAIDDMSSLARSIDEADPLSWQVFSNGAVTWTVNPGESIRHRFGSRLISVPDVKQALGGITPFQEWTLDQTPGSVAQIGNAEMLSMPKPKEPGKRLWMVPVDTTRLFLRGLSEHFPGFLSAYYDKFRHQKVDNWVAHQPTLGVFTLADRQLSRSIREMNLPVPEFKWTGVEGNSSGATTLISLVRQLPEMSGNTIGMVSYGAGAGITFEIFETGRQK